MVELFTKNGYNAERSPTGDRKAERYDAEMNLLTDNVKQIYFRYLLLALGSTIIVSVYSTVDMIAVGQYEGPIGSAALSCVNPIWTIIFSVGLLFGVGGSVFMSVSRGAGEREEGNRYFTFALLAALGISMAMTMLLMVYLAPLLRFFGAKDQVLPCALSYARWVVRATPAFLLGQVLVCFIRNDGSPGLCTKATVTGGVVNMFGDYFFVFVLDMGAEGAGLATALGQLAGCSILIAYFFRDQCGLRLVAGSFQLWRLKKIFSAGFAPCIIDAAFGVVVVLFNRQIMAYAGSVELAVFGTIANCAILFQCLFYGVGQAVQPIVSTNFGAGHTSRVEQVLKMAMITTAVMGCVFFSLAFFASSFLLQVYMDVTAEVMAIGPGIFRIYGFTFLFTGINVVAGYYLQSILKTAQSVILSLTRGYILCSVLVFVLPAMFGFHAIWYTMPLTEGITVLLSAAFLKGKCMPARKES